MIPSGFEYRRATSIDDALAALASADAKLIAGGHSLLPLMRFRLAEPATLIDIGDLAELKGIGANAAGVRIGAAATYRDLLDDASIAAKYPLIVEATNGIGDRQVRNRGTVGGALAHADPASDMPAVMLALGATFRVRSKGGQREIAARDFFTGLFSTALKDGEILTDILLPAPAAGAGSAYVGFDQKASGYAIAAAAAVVTRKGNAIGSATVALTGVSDRARLVDASGLTGVGGADDAAIGEALAGITNGIDISADIHASAAYRKHLAHVAARRAVRTAFDRAK